MSALIPVSSLYRLDRTLSCGQAFRWRWHNGTANGTFAGHRITLTQGSDGIRVEGMHETHHLEALGRYLGADEPLGTIEEALCRDRVLRRILPHTSGIALLRQDPWECLVSFIISAFNNIPKIELTLDRMCRRFGAVISPDVWAFPDPTSLASATLRELRTCALGYRAGYVRTVGRLVADGSVDLRGLDSLPYDDARLGLLELPGVGDKVADCVLLFAYGKGEAFPVDVWVKRALERWYFRRRMSEHGIRAFARTRFGPLAGYAQQHLYYFARTHRRRRSRSIE
jgi:N-glycosylase/DNA lyase